MSFVFLFVFSNQKYVAFLISREFFLIDLLIGIRNQVDSCSGEM